MENKEDWEQLEKWQAGKKEEYEQQYGADISDDEFDVSNEKTKQTLKKINIFVKVLLVIISLILLYMLIYIINFFLAGVIGI